MKIDPDELVDQTEAAKMRGVTHQAIVRLVAKGRFKTVKISGRIFLFRSEVENFQPTKSGPKPTAKKATKKATKRSR